MNRPLQVLLRDCLCVRLQVGFIPMHDRSADCNNSMRCTDMLALGIVVDEHLAESPGIPRIIRSNRRHDLRTQFPTMNRRPEPHILESLMQFSRADKPDRQTWQNRPSEAP